MCIIELYVGIGFSPYNILVLEIDCALAVDWRLSLECGFNGIYAVLSGDVLRIAHAWMLIRREGRKSIESVHFLRCLLSVRETMKVMMSADVGFFPKLFKDFFVLQSGATMQLLKDIVLNLLPLLSERKIYAKR